MLRRTISYIVTLVMIGMTSVYSQDAKPLAVTVDNFIRAETDTYFARFVKEGGFGKFQHERELADIDHQTVIRLNRDTLYSFAVFDLDAGPVTITLPNPAQRFLSMLVINEDHYDVSVVYQPGAHTLTKEMAGTRYACVAMRIFVNPNDPADIKTVHGLQDAIQVQQKSAGKFDTPNWDKASLDKIRAALLALVAANGELNSAKMFGRKEDVDPVQHLLGTAAGWGGNPRKDAYYIGVIPKNADGKTPFRLTLQDVPVDGFWSVSVYNKDGFFQKNPENAYTLNNITAKPGSDGTYTIQFGGCDGKTPNCLPIVPGWNYLIRLYRPRAEVLDGTWKLPEAQPVK